MAARLTSAAVRGTMIGVGGRVAVIEAIENNNLVADGKGRVGVVIVWGDNAGTAITVTVYDHGSTNTNPFFRWATAQGLGVFAIQAPFNTGLRVVVAGTTIMLNGGVTIVWEGPGA